MTSASASRVTRSSRSLRRAALLFAGVLAGFEIGHRAGEHHVVERRVLEREVAVGAAAAAEVVERVGGVAVCPAA